MYWDRLLISDNYVFLLLMKFMTVYYSHENLARLLLARRHFLRVLAYCWLT